jgi:hypothetical protein
MMRQLIVHMQARVEEMCVVDTVMYIANLWLIVAKVAMKMMLLAKLPVLALLLTVPMVMLMAILYNVVFIMRVFQRSLIVPFTALTPMFLAVAFVDHTVIIIVT